MVAPLRWLKLQPRWVRVAIVASSVIVMLELGARVWLHRTTPPAGSPDTSASVNHAVLQTYPLLDGFKDAATRTSSDRPVERKMMAVAGDLRDALVLPANGEAHFLLAVAPGAQLLASYASVSNRGTQPNNGAEFSVSIRNPLGAKPRRLFVDHVDPGTREAAGQWHDMDLDLGVRSETLVQITFETRVREPSTGRVDWTLWAQPQLRWSVTRSPGPNRQAWNATVGQLFEQMTPHPAVGYVFNPNSSADITVWGTRGPHLPRFEADTAADTALDTNNRDTVVVAVLGGATAHDMAATANEILVRRLSQAPPFAGQRVKVINLAIPGYRQPQQLSMLLYMLSAGAQFDAIINLDGGPDLTSLNIRADGHGDFLAIPGPWRALTTRLDDPGVVEKIGLQKVLEEDRERWVRRCAQSLWSSLAVARAVCLRRTSNLDQRIVQLQRSVNFTEAARRSSFGPRYAAHEIRVALKDLATLWQRSSKILHQICKRQGIPYFHFLQPLATNEDAKPLTPEERARIQPATAGHGSALLKVAQKAARHLGEQLRAQGVEFHDLTTIFADHRETVYVDGCCQLNRSGTRIVADAIATTVATSLNAQP